MEQDILARIIERFRELEPAFTHEKARFVEDKIRQEYAGEITYIQAKRAELREEAVREAFNGRNIDDICQKLGVHRSTVYRLLKRKKQRNC